MDLDALLEGVAPVVADRTPQLEGLLDEMVVASRPPRTGRRHRRLAWASGGAILAGALGVTGAAAAVALVTYTHDNVPDSLVNGTFSWTSDQGHSCRITAGFGPRASDDPSYSSSQQAALAAVQRWVDSFDIGSVDRGAAEERWFGYLERISVDHPSRAELVEKFQGDQLEMSALAYEVSHRIDDTLTAQGFDPQVLNSGVGAECEK